MDLIKMKRMKVKRFIKTESMLNQIYTTVVNLLFTNTRILKNLLEIPLLQKKKDLFDFKTNLVLFYKETIGIKLTNEDQN